MYASLNVVVCNVGVFFPVTRNVEAKLIPGKTSGPADQTATVANETFLTFPASGTLASSARIELKAEDIGLNRSYIALDHLKICYANPN